jgi:PTS system nitrogen regulatory IIA component
VLRSVVDMLPLPDEVDREFLLQVLLVRESMGSTGIGNGGAI